MRRRDWSRASKTASLQDLLAFWRNHDAKGGPVAEALRSKDSTPQWITHELSDAGLRFSVDGTLRVSEGDPSGWAAIERAWRYDSLHRSVFNQRYDELHVEWPKTDRAGRIRIGRVAHTDLIQGALTWT